MTRKDFIQKSITMGVGLPLFASLLTSCEEYQLIDPNFQPNFNGKVLIIGAGSAGLTAGYLLKQFDIDFQIIEASDRFGGRVKRAADFADFPIDLGAEWIHEDPVVLDRLINDSSVTHGIETIVYNPQTIYNWKNGKLKKQNWASNLYSEYKFKQTTWYDFFEQFIVPEIADKIVYNSPISKIDYTADKVVLETPDNQIFEADRVLVTVPIKILQKDIIEFSPQLPQAKRNAINSITMPDGIKVFVEFSERFYPDMLLFGGLLKAAFSDDRLYYDAAFGKDSNRHILGLFSVGDSATAYASLNSDEEIIEKVLAELDKVFDGKASQSYIKHVIQNWSKEPYIQGSYSYEYAESEKKTKEELQKPIDNKIYFSGEALSIDNGSTVPGAAESSYRVVQQILSA